MGVVTRHYQGRYGRGERGCWRAVQLVRHGPKDGWECPGSGVIPRLHTISVWSRFLGYKGVCDPRYLAQVILGLGTEFTGTSTGVELRGHDSWGRGWERQIVSFLAFGFILHKMISGNCGSRHWS